MVKGLLESVERGDCSLEAIAGYVRRYGAVDMGDTVLLVYVAYL